MGWLIALGVLVLLAVLPLGVSARYNAQGPLVRIIAGPVRITVFPLRKKEKKDKKKPAKVKETVSAPAEPAPQNPPAPPKPKQENKGEEKGGSFLDFMPLVKLAFDFLGDFRRKLRLDNLELKLIMAGGDPANLAINYGRAWAAVGNLMPHLENLFVIKKRNVEVECDFTASETLIFLHVDITITLGRLLALVVVYGIRAVKEFLNLTNQRKGGAKQ